MPTWALLINMLKGEKDEDKEASVKCLQLLTHSDKKFWPSIKSAGGIDKLFSILRTYASSVTPAPLQQQNQIPNQPGANLLLTKIEPLQVQENQQKKGPRSELRPRGSTKKTATIKNSKETIALNAILVLCNLSDQFEVRVALSEINDLRLSSEYHSLIPEDLTNMPQGPSKSKTFSRKFYPGSCKSIMKKYG